MTQGVWSFVEKLRKRRCDAGCTRVVRYFVLKYGYEPQTKTKTIFIAVQTFIAVQIFFPPLKPRLVEYVQTFSAV